MTKANLDERGLKPETRKVQVTGGSSYTVTLPKEWIRQLDVKKNDSLVLAPQPDGTLLVSTGGQTKKFQKTKEFHVNSETDPNYLFRLLVGAYIMGFTYLNILSEGRISPAVRDCVTNFTQTAIGPEIVEETLNSIMIKDLVNPTEMPFDKSIRRMYILVRTMHEDVVEALKGRDASLADDIISRDREINRRHWLIGRQANMVLQDVILAQKMGVTLENATHYFIIARHLERIGDHAVRLAVYVKDLIRGGVAGSLVDDVARASGLALELLGKSLEAWNRRDIHMANESIERISELVPLCEQISNQASNHEGLALPLIYIAESIRRTGEYAGNISENVINYLMEEATSTAARD
ncbi:MAG: PhoU domain-containing protein [Promethearchaeota archaeon]